VKKPGRQFQMKNVKNESTMKSTAFLKIVTFLLVCLGKTECFSQDGKKTINFFTGDLWPEISGEKISNNGKYACFATASRKTGRVLTILEVNRLWKIDIPGAKNERFTSDNRFLLFKNQGDSLGVISLGKSTILYLGRADWYAVNTDGGISKVIWLVKNEGLRVFDLNTRAESYFPGVLNCVWSNDGNNLILEGINFGTKNESTLTWLNLRDGRKKQFYQGRLVSNLLIDKAGKTLAFTVLEKSDSRSQTSIYSYKIGDSKSYVLVDNKIPGILGRTVLGRGIYFSDLGDKIFFNAISPPDSNQVKSKENHLKVDIWHYKYDRLQGVNQLKSEEDDMSTDHKPVLFVISIQSKKNVVRLQGLNDLVVLRNDRFLVVRSEPRNSDGERQNEFQKGRDYYLVNCKDGSRMPIAMKLVTNTGFKFSPAGNYIYWFDQTIRKWMTYEMKSNITRSVNIPEPITIVSDAYPVVPEGIAGWTKNDESILVYGRYDIWSVNMKYEAETVINLTGGYGTRHSTRLRVLNLENNGQNAVPLKQRLILSAFNITTKQSGFFELSLSQKNMLRCIEMGFGNYHQARYSTAIQGGESPFRPLKARDANVFLIKKMSPVSFPNLFVTKNLKDLKALTRLAPQKEYNWYTSELFHFKYDGHIAEGILYKPENFDASRKYPVIFYYYERNGDALNTYIHPYLTGADLNIPWYVSNGYIVVVPDIFFYDFKNGRIGEGALKAVNSAADYISKFSWIDSKHMGLQGHSFGGFETNYIIANCSRYAAAVSAAGVVNFSSDYTQAYNGNNLGFFEVGQPRLGGSLGEMSERYINNSPIFKVKNITTPVLLVHNKSDGDVPWQQGYDWFRNLTREGKKVWLLQYDEEGHVIYNYANQLDFTIRMSQFFDHYLKGKPAPFWMTRGIPDSRKGIDTGYESDPGVEP